MRIHKETMCNTIVIHKEINQRKDPEDMQGLEQAVFKNDIFGPAPACAHYVIRGRCTRCGQEVTL